jgi:hypothetical protein
VAGPRRSPTNSWPSSLPTRFLARKAQYDASSMEMTKSRRFEVKADTGFRFGAFGSFKNLALVN